MPSDEKGFWKELWVESKPIVNHSLCVFVNIICLVFIGIILLGLEYLFPDKREFISYIKIVDLWLVLALLCLLGLKTFLIVAIKSWHHIKEEVAEKK